MDLSKLATEVTAILAPALPYLYRAGATAAQEAVDRIGQAVYDGAKALWARIAPSLTTDPASEAATRGVAERPEDEDEQAIFQAHLKKLLTKDPELAGEIERLLQGGILQRVLAEEGGIARRVKQQIEGQTSATQEVLSKGGTAEDIDQSIK